MSIPDAANVVRNALDLEEERMQKHIFIVYTNAVEGRDDEYNAWYDDQHLNDVLKIPGVVAALMLSAFWGVTGHVGRLENVVLSHAIVLLGIPLSLLSVGFSAIEKAQVEVQDGRKNKQRETRIGMTGTSGAMEIGMDGRRTTKRQATPGTRPKQPLLLPKR